MRLCAILLAAILVSACTALMVGGAGVVGYQLGKDERPAAVVASDSAITTRIKAKHAADSIVSVFDVSVRTYEGAVTLTGTVGSIAAREQAALLARDTNGVETVDNRIIVEDNSQ